jgi:hypothetical protein
MGPHKPPKIKVKPPKPKFTLSGKGTKPSGLPYYDSGLLYDTVGLFYTETAGTFPVAQLPKINVERDKSNISSVRPKSVKINVYKPKISIKDIL